MNSVLMVAYHYPPHVGGSGVLRTLKHSRYLAHYGWEPIVLTAHPRAYERKGEEQVGDVPATVRVTRAFALDAGHHLAVRGVTLRILKQPDRWATWWLGAVLAGWRLIRRHRPRAIWSTYPIATAHLIGLTLHRLTGLPWVADFRDSMTEPDYPRDTFTRRTYRWIERRTVASAARLVFTASSTRQMYLDRYPSLDPERCLVIPNGYDEEDFRGLAAAPGRCDGHGLRLLHAGFVYPEERDPRLFFRALSRLKRNGAISAEALRIDLRAAGSEDQYGRLLAELDITDIVRLLPALPYREALRDAAEANAMLLLQGASCNHQIPAKVYEYFRLGKPILGLTPEEGDTGRLLREVGGSTVIDLHDEEAMVQDLPVFLAAVRTDAHAVPPLSRARRYSRDILTRDLAACLDGLIPPARQLSAMPR